MLVDANGNPINQSATIPDTSQGNNDGKPQGDEENASGTNSVNNKITKPESITPEVQAYIDSQNAAARRAGEAKAKTDADKADVTAKAEQAKRDAEKKGEFEKLRNEEVTAHNETKAEKANVEREFNQLRAALAAKVPDADKHYKRIVGNTYDEMLEDAKIVAATFSGGAYNNPNNPPIVPTPNDGGKFDQTGNKVGVTDKDLQNESARSNYNVF